MRRSEMRRSIPTLSLLLVLLVPGHGGAQTEVERTVPLASDGSVEIETIAGSITVTAWPRDEVRISATLGRGAGELEIEGGGDAVSIEVSPRSRRGRDSWHAGDREAHLQVRVPEGARIDIETISAEVALSGTTGEAAVTTVSGSLRVESRLRRLEAETVSGEIDLVEGAGRVEIETVSGPVTLRGGYDELEVETVNGGVDLQSRAVQRGALESVSGSLRLDLWPAPGADLEASSHSGSLEVVVPRDVSAHFSASTFSGRIRSDLGPRPRRTSRYGSEKELEFTAGDGDATVRLETFSGDLRLRVR
ncbi:MAG: DUF4097 family beta strand repeat-containing protein [Acidobacteriota bacterium]